MNPIRIGTRSSPLAMWQALEVEQKLKKLGVPAQLIPITSIGDKNLTQPLYQMNIVGVFTRDLDIALLNNEIDIAVHSLKDIPTIMPEGVILSAVLERDYEEDVLVRNPNKKYRKDEFNSVLIGTGSLRRRAFWRSAYPQVKFDNIRGNVQTRLKKLESEKFDGTIFSLAGIKRLKLSLEYEVLDFIIPAPGQGVVGITSLERNAEITKLVTQINHKNTEYCIEVERKFLNVLEGGCTAPIGANAKIIGNNIHFKAGVISLDGSKRVLFEEFFPISEYQERGRILAKKAKEQGADKIIEEIKKIQ